MSQDPIETMNLGGYQVVGRLGQGAMADVYDAVDSTGHEVALKVFKAGGGMSYTMLERFRREAEATKILRRHPYILTVYASGHEGDYHYIAMEKVKDSRSLDSYIHRKPPRGDILQIGIKLAEALQYSHDHQIIHRDVKPSNILLDEANEPMLTDFGVAELTDWPSLTLSGALTGTPMYMAPEQARSEQATPESDVYSLGVVMYEALVGQMPYDLSEAAPTSEILNAVKHQNPLSPRLVDKTITRDLAYVLLRALRKTPSERYGSAREFAQDLQLILDGKPVAGRWVSPWTRGRLWVRQHRTGLAGILAFVLMGFAGWYRLREVLSKESYRQLILMARDVSKGVELARQSSTDRAAPVMKSARQAMQSRRLMDARGLLQTAMEINRVHGEIRPMTEAMLELARVEVMLFNSHRGKQLYREIRLNSDAQDALRQQAGFEELMLALLDGERQQAEEIIISLSETPSRPYRMLMDVAFGNELPPKIEGLVQTWQLPLQRSYRLASVIRNDESQSKSQRKSQLMEMIKEAGDSNEWPLPFALYIRERL